MHDLVIRNGLVVDGTGAPARPADVAVEGDRIVAVGPDVARGRREIDADGAVVAPGWVDVHTHYDGQALWDPEMRPSSDHGVTTAVMGNCGVGFAPVRPGEEDYLVEVMEGVEDIPGTALHEGIDWRWESFREYLDALSELPRTLDLGTQVPHAAVRTYVLGRHGGDADLDDRQLALVTELVADGIAAGALGFTTSRTVMHTSKHGVVPGTHAPSTELLRIGEAMAAAGGGVFQFLSDNVGGGEDRVWMKALARLPGVTVTYSMAQTQADTTGFLRLLDANSRDRSQGMRIVPQVPARPTGMLFGLQTSLHPFIAHPTYRSMRGLSLAERVARMHDPEVRAALLAEEAFTRDAAVMGLASSWPLIFRLGERPDYEPAPSTSVAAVARQEGRTPQEVVYDWLLEDQGRALLFSPLASYFDGDHEAIRAMLAHPASIVGLADGGAHCRLICDASFPTYLLTHWVRDRLRGERLPLELVVHKQTGATADAFGLHDRGRLAPGALADLNVIDLPALQLHAPRMFHDLPAGGARLIQGVDGYVLTLKSGRPTFEEGVMTDERPGRVLRRAAG